MNIPIRVSISQSLKGIRCVVAERDIKAGELIESCPVILIPLDEYEALGKTVMSNYDFIWDECFEALVLGYGSLYNHSYTPNAFYRRNFITKKMEYVALHDIKKGEEIFLNYNGKPDDTAPLEHGAHTDFKL